LYAVFMNGNSTFGLCLQKKRRNPQNTVRY